MSSILVGVRRAAGKPQEGFNNARDLTLRTCSLWARPRDMEGVTLVLLAKLRPK